MKIFKEILNLALLFSSLKIVCIECYAVLTQIFSCSVDNIQSTPDNSNLEGKLQLAGFHMSDLNEIHVEGRLVFGDCRSDA